jgi:diguanylate cyclase (GGDEF)-like protein
VSTLNRQTWFPLAAATIVLMAVLAFFYGKTQHFGEPGYLENVTLLRHLRQLDAQWELDVMKSRVGINTNYDPLSGSQTELITLLDKLDVDIEQQEHAEAPRLAAARAKLREIFLVKAALIERFKSNNALLRNSLTFLPTATEDAHQAVAPRAGAGDGLAAVSSSMSAVISNLLLDSLLYTQNATEGRRAAIRDGLRHIDPRRRGMSPDAADKLGTFTAHVETILRVQTLVEELLDDTAALPTGVYIDELGNILAMEQLNAEMRQQRYREYLLIFSAALITLLLYAAVRLVRNHAVIRESRDKLLEYGRGLEAMVADRVAALRESEARMTQLAQFDSLTGLPNRNLFRDRLTLAMARADRDERPMALMFVDLDHFKQINDSLGHAVGDEVLKGVAKQLRTLLREADTIARLGGDEFTIILEGLAEPTDAEAVAAKIKEALSRPLFVDGHEFVVSASIGVALYPFFSNDADSLLQAADIAMYRAKEAGRNAHAMFEPEMAVQISERVNMKNLLRHALERGEFELQYQPKLGLRSGRVEGVEALLRWNSAELGSVSPMRFIALAEEMGLIVPIGDWVLRTACAQGRRWQQQGLPLMTVAVNLSPRQLREPRLIERISAALHESGFPARLLELELTEGVLMDDVQGNIDTLMAIRELGVSLAVDDFGTGYSSLAYLARLPIQTLKIDRAFVASMQADANGLTLVSTMVTLAHSLKLQVVAEGVETTEQQRMLTDLGCDQIQGYHFSRPIPAADLAAMVCQSVSCAASNRPSGETKPARDSGQVGAFGQRLATCGL